MFHEESVHLLVNVIDPFVAHAEKAVFAAAMGKSLLSLISVRSSIPNSIMSFAPYCFEVNSGRGDFARGKSRMGEG